MNKKIKNALTLVGVLIVIYLAVTAIDFFFFLKNDVNENCINVYIDNSIEMDLEVPKNLSVTVKFETIYTGIETAFLRGKTKKFRYSRLTFYNASHQKYFSLVMNSTKLYVYSALALGKTTRVRVNEEELKSNNYGTIEKPVPIFMMDIPEYKNNGDFEEDKITEQQYQTVLYYYLSYMMPKEEFKQRFKNK